MSKIKLAIQKLLLLVYGKEKEEEIAAKLDDTHERIRQRQEARIEAKVSAKISLGPKAKDYEDWLGIATGNHDNPPEQEEQDNQEETDQPEQV